MKSNLPGQLSLSTCEAANILAVSLFDNPFHETAKELVEKLPYRSKAVDKIFKAGDFK